jgi:hypothetical protein
MWWKREPPQRMIDNLILANISNGLAFPHDDVCYFQSQHGHSWKNGYFRIDAMPLRAVIHLMLGRTVTIIDATRRHKKLTDAFKFGVPTWCIVYNHAICQKVDKVCLWQTKEMETAAHSTLHEKLIQTIRKLAKYYQPTKPAVIGDNIKLVCHQNFMADDKPKRIQEIILTQIWRRNNETV